MRGGETGTQVIKFGQYQRADATTGETKTGAYLKTYSVFNVAQCDGITLPQVERPNLAERVERADASLHGVSVPIYFGSDRAFYRPSTDTVYMPSPDAFRPVGDATATEMFYAVGFHEIGHATGHERRLNRDLKARFGDATYAAEELVAELCSVFVMAELGLAHKPKQNANEYLAHWLGILRADSKALMTAAAKASAAANFIFKTGQEAAEGPGEGNCDGSLSTTRPTTLRDRERCHLPEPSGDIMSKHHPTSAYGRRITELRERVGITQSALARVLRVQPSAVNHIEAGRALPCSDRLRALAAALHVRVEAVMP